MRRAKGIGLFSGGLDSVLAARILMEAGAEVLCLYFQTGFSAKEHQNLVRREDDSVVGDILRLGAEIGALVEVVDISKEFLGIVLHPKYGYGSEMNPCIDCKAFMLKKAKEHMVSVGADFVFTGEVLGQRPMSQTRGSLAIIEREAGLEGLLLRPLSAKLLTPTSVEMKGLIDREKLLDINGRSRKRQLELAKKFGITGFKQPAGGCLLTDGIYSRKLRDIFDHKEEDSLSMDDIHLLSVGRHFRLSPLLKVIVGRNEAENDFLMLFSQQYWSATSTRVPGPTALVLGEMDSSDFERIASLVARYSDGKREPTVEVEFSFGEQTKVLNAAPAPDALLDSLRI